MSLNGLFNGLFPVRMGCFVPIDMKFTVRQLILFIQQQITQEFLQINRIFPDSFSDD